MCGIAGFFQFNGEKANSEIVARMAETLAPRGPDGVGIFHQNNIALGHRRLKIMDLSESAHQPMIDSNLGLSLVFNGAIYNYPELKKELESYGYQFFSNSDTEVILKGFHYWREKLLDKLNGMFAFAIWERDKNQLFCARDRLGIKPFYYSADSHRFVFASTIPALLKAGVNTNLNPVALHHYFTFHSVVPAPHTLISSVKKLPPGHYMTITADGSQKLIPYWKLSCKQRQEEQSWTEADWKEALLNALNTSTQRRMLADVPVGVLLSGGVDSSLVVALLRESGVKDLKTFSIGFNCHGGEDGNEFRYSDYVADHFDTEHHKYLIGTQKLINVLPDCLSAMSEPMMSHDCVGFYILAQEVAKKCKVVQSGQGADEILAGYHWYPAVHESDNPLDAYQHSFFDRSHDEIVDLFIDRLFSENFSSMFVKEHFDQLETTEAVDKALHIDTTVMLVDDPVKRVDNMTMAWGLEARVPFLDHELVELTARMPSQYKLPDGGKYLLKSIARDWLPSSLIDRPKGYFPVPELKYITGDVHTFVQEILNQPQAQQRGLFNPDVVSSYLEAPKEHITPLNGSKLWQIAVLESWLQTNNI